MNKVHDLLRLLFDENVQGNILSPVKREVSGKIRLASDKS